MHTSTIAAVKHAVEQGAAASQNELVEEAIIARLREIRRAKVYASYLEAAADPAFMDDMREAVGDFDVTLGDATTPQER